MLPIVLFIGLLLGCDAFCQGVTVRSNNGRSTNESHYGTLSLYNGSGVSIGGIGPSEFAGHGGSLTNVPSKFFASIAAMTNSTPTSNLVVYVDSYFGTNLSGGGKFKWENSSDTFNGGTVGGIGVYTNTLTATPIVLPVGVNCGFIIRSGVGVDIQTFAQ